MKVSLVITNYNRGDLLPSIAAMLPPSDGRIAELLVIDNASPIPPEPFVARAESIAPCPLRLLKNESNLGVAASRNRGMRDAAGEAVLFIDSDVTFEPTCVSLLIDGLQDSDITFPQALYDDGAFLSPVDDFTRKLCLNSMMFAIRKEALGRMTDWFDEYMGMYQEDVDFFLRASAVGLRFKFIETAVVRHPFRDTLNAGHVFFALRNSLWMSFKLAGLAPYRCSYPSFVVKQSVLWLVNAATRRHWAFWPRRVGFSSSRFALLCSYVKAWGSFVSHCGALRQMRGRIRRDIMMSGTAVLCR